MMQRIKAALLLRRNNLRIHILHFLNQYHTRTLCSLPDTAITDELDNQVLVEGKAWSRAAILNRPSVLNCLSTAMVCLLLDTLCYSVCVFVFLAIELAPNL